MDDQQNLCDLRLCARNNPCSQPSCESDLSIVLKVPCSRQWAISTEQNGHYMGIYCVQACRHHVHDVVLFACFATVLIDLFAICRHRILSKRGL